MKKFVVLFFCLLLCFGGLGCSKDLSFTVEQNISEKVELYFCGVGEFNVSVSSGEREEPYVYDGKRGNMVEFSIFSVYIENLRDDKIEIELDINDQKSIRTFEYNPLSGCYVFDLEKKMKKDDNIRVSYRNSEVRLLCFSSEFKIDCKKAINIATECFEEDMLKLFSKNELRGECYLRVLDNPKDDFKNKYWYFYVFAENKTSYSCVIDVYTGEIITKN